MKSLNKHPIHLGLGAKAFSEPEFSGMEWYEEYARRHQNDGAEGRLVSMHQFSQPWTQWEMHPHGHEVVICISGSICLIQEIDGQEKKMTLNPLEYAFNPPGVWHTADANEEATVLFITAGEGTEHRPR